MIIGGIHDSHRPGHEETMGSQNAVATGGGKGLGASVSGPIALGGGINEVRQYLLNAATPVTAEQIREHLCLTHERVYELLVKLEGQHQAKVSHTDRQIAWEAL